MEIPVLRDPKIYAGIEDGSIRILTPAEAQALRDEYAERERARAAARAATIAEWPSRKLAALKPGGSVVLHKYRKTTQLSATIKAVSDRHAFMFKSSRELSLVDGECIGIRVTRVI